MTYGAMCDGARKQAAQTYLADTTLSIADVTYLLGWDGSLLNHKM